VEGGRAGLQPPDRRTSATKNTGHSRGARAEADRRGHSRWMEKGIYCYKARKGGRRSHG
jgi:hypothetical protein